MDNDEEEDEEEEMSDMEILVSEIRSTRTLLAYVAILLTIMTFLMVYVFLHLTRLVLAP
jgi:hypothetical protein